MNGFTFFWCEVRGAESRVKKKNEMNSLNVCIARKKNDFYFFFFLFYFSKRAKSNG
jgi:hypothetical protein